ncbi:ras-related protein Ral-A isoform X2 [Manis pentadactyla]|uniref:ras-related protein Ral-A isoform X2 n=1 Tax=Manis pentadactyla TaxID=143292 RepID=UPI00255C9478|nr:ras-related protein Ral-A isoform X2 [Manis pentadactyla]
MNARKRAPPAIVLQPRPQHSPLGPRTGSCCPAGPAPLPCAPEVLCGRCCSAARRRVDLLRVECRESSSSCRSGAAAARRTHPSVARSAEPPRQQGPKQLSGRSQLNRGFGSPRGGGPAGCRYTLSKIMKGLMTGFSDVKIIDDLTKSLERRGLGEVERSKIRHNSS